MKISVFQSAAKIQYELLEAGIEKCKKNFNIELASFVEEEPNENYFIASVDKRRESFLKAMKSDGNILWAARGGYGSVDVLSLLEKKLKLMSTKKVLGCSDVTSIHALLSNNNIVSYHAPMLATQNWINSSENIVNSVRSVLYSDVLVPVPLADKTKSFSGRLVGGNLAVLSSLMGTPWELQLREGDILFLEDIAEPYYKLSRMLKQLSYSANFDKVKLCFGEMKDCAKGFESEDDLIKLIMKDYSNEYVSGLAAGHGVVNYCLPLNHNVEIKEGLLSPICD